MQKHPTDDTQPVEDGLVLYYGLQNDDQETMIRALLSRLNMMGKKINEADVNQRMGNLAGIDGFTEQSTVSDTADIPTESIVVMHRLSDGKINTLLSELRILPDLKIDLKAVVTENNTHWTFQELAEELRSEHAAMSIYTSFISVVEQVEVWMGNNAANYSEQQPMLDRLKAAIQHAHRIIATVQSQGDIDTEELTRAGRDIVSLHRQLTV